MSDKLDRLLEEVAATREQVANLEEQLDELKNELKPVFFQATAIKFSGMAAAGLLGLIATCAALFPALGSAAVKILVGALLKGSP